MSESAATKSRDKKLNAARSRVSYSYNFSYDKHWVFEDYKSGEFAIHGPFDTKEEADSQMTELKEYGGSMGFEIKRVDDKPDEYGMVRRALNGE
ncbi:MAG: hypothetical protein AB7V18_20545 [Pyrinomonadaceae bacterium]